VLNKEYQREDYLFRQNQGNKHYNVGILLI